MLAGALLLVAGSASGLVIDDFLDGDLLLEPSGSFPSSMETLQTNLTAVAGGARRVRAATVDRATLRIDAAAGEFRFESTSDFGYFTLEYGSDSPLDLDLLADGGDAFELVVAGLTPGLWRGQFSFNVYSASGSARYTFLPELMALDGPGYLRIPFAALAGADLTSVQRIVLDVIRFERGYEVRLRSIRTVAEESALTPRVLWESASPGTRSAAVAIMPDGQHALGHLRDEQGTPSVEVRRIDTGAVVTNLPSGVSLASALVCAPNGEYFAVSGWSGAVEVWRVGEGTPAYNIPTVQQFEPVAFQPDGDLMAMGNGTRIELRVPATGELVHAWTNDYRLTSLAFSPDGALLASGAGIRGMDTHLSLWTMPDGLPAGRLPTPHSYNISEIAFSPDGAFVATGELAGDALVAVTRLSDGATVGAAPAAVWGLAFAPDGRGVLAGVEPAGLLHMLAPTLHTIRHDPMDTRGRADVAVTPIGDVAVSAWDHGMRAVATPVQTTGLSHTSTPTLQWTGGRPPFQLQRAHTLAGDSWISVGTPTTNRVAEIPTPSQGAFYRVMSAQD